MAVMIAPDMARLSHFVSSLMERISSLTSLIFDSATAKRVMTLIMTITGGVFGVTAVETFRRKEKEEEPPKPYDDFSA